MTERSCCCKLIRERICAKKSKTRRVFAPPKQSRSKNSVPASLEKIVVVGASLAGHNSMRRIGAYKRLIETRAGLDGPEPTLAAALL